MNIKIFADGANIEDMKKVYKEGVVEGFTTNPTLMKKAGIVDYTEFAKNVLKEITNVPVSFEVFSDDFESMEREAIIINGWAKNTNVKIPIMNTKGESTIPLIKKLLEKGIRLNITAILTKDQIDSIAKILPPHADIIISIFAGRIADTGVNPMPIMKHAEMKFALYDGVKILWASTRELYNVIQAEESGCQIITCPNDIIKKLSMIGKDLNELSLETVQMFYNDAKSLGYKI